MRIKIFSDFCDSLTCKHHYERVCHAAQLPYYGPQKALYITTGDDYTHAILLNTAMPVLKNIGRANVLGLAFEPPPFLQLTPQFIQYAQKYIGKYFIGSKYFVKDYTYTDVVLPDLFKEHYAYMWHITPPLVSAAPQKKHLMSIMVSDKQNAPGHQYRHTLVKLILSKGLPIDIYGRGANLYKGLYGSIYKNDKRLKGQFKDVEPYHHYVFHICIENFMTPAYFSEKITNTLLSSAIPIYWGCTKILNYFPANVIPLSGDVDKDIDLLQAIVAEPRKYRLQLDVPRIKNKLNLLQNAKNLFA
jgi:hypothetical protein